MASAPIFAGCTASLDPPTNIAESDLVGRRSGAGIPSPNVKPAATYLTARTVDALARVGALDPEMTTVVTRADGIIANQPADGRFSIEELLQLEAPGFIATLFPGERAKLPAVWSLLETTNAAPKALSFPPAPTTVAVDASKGPSLVRPAFLATATLGEHRAAAERLQLLHDADSDDQTVHEADLWGAIASPGPFLPAEVASFHAILELFDERATSSMDARVEVTAPKLERASAVVTFAPSLVVDHVGTLRYEWTRSSDPKQPPRLVAIGTAGYTLRGNGQLVLIDESTQLESVYSPGPLGVAKFRAGTYTGEVWLAGKRVQTLRVVLDGSKAREQRVQLDAYADYTLVAMGQVLKPSTLTETCPTGAIQTATWTFTHEPTWKVTTQCRSSGALAPPKLTVPSGRYAVNQDALTNVDLYPQGFAVVTFAGESIRAHGYGYSVSGRSADGQTLVVYNASNNRLEVRRNGEQTPRVSVMLHPAMRTL